MVHCLTLSHLYFTSSQYPKKTVAQNAREMLEAFLTFIVLRIIRGSQEKGAQEESGEQRTQATQELVLETLNE
jgi:hypothetical protein